ncbi:acyl-CoA dehydrogenase family protein [Ferrovibrio xuzhouensis]|uniref:Acyl-CoA dehydrogenase family protein n=1 Tax=Ferrovibrio xuzhouensis TaxID=1576914 RepID=A0ABV7VCW3_9PROT
MDFRLNDDQRALQEAARSFARGELPVLARDLEEKNEPVPAAMRRRYAELGFLGINMPEAYGGLGLGHIEALLVLEQFAQVSPAVAFPVFESATGPVRTVLHFASESLRQRILPPVIRGEMVVAVSMSEPHAGTALTDLTTKARIDGDAIVLDGQKRWSSGGGHADAYVVYCRLSDAPGAAGIGAVLVEKDRPGLRFGKPEKLMGFRGIPSCDIFLDGVRVPRDNLIVPAGGFRKLMEAFDLERCGNATMSLGIAAAALEEALAYVQERRQFGKPLVEFQAVQLKLADMAMRVEAARLLIWRAAQNAADGLPSIADASIAKCFANEMVREVAAMGIQVMGGYGYSTEYRMEQRLRDGFGWGIAGGAIDVQKTNIAAALVGRRFSQRG